MALRRGFTPPSLLRYANDFFQRRETLSDPRETLLAQRGHVVPARALEQRKLRGARENELAQLSVHPHHLVDADSAGETGAATFGAAGASPQRRRHIVAEEMLDAARHRQLRLAMRANPPDETLGDDGLHTRGEKVRLDAHG